MVNSWSITTDLGLRARAERRGPCGTPDEPHSKERVLPMKWHTLNVYLKVVTMLSTVTALLLAAGADFKWC